MTPPPDHDHYGEEVLGRRCLVLFAEEDGKERPYAGTITAYAVTLKSTGIEREHCIHFDDGDKRWFDLDEEKRHERLWWSDVEDGKPPARKEASAKRAVAVTQEDEEEDEDEEGSAKQAVAVTQEEMDEQEEVEEEEDEDYTEGTSQKKRPPAAVMPERPQKVQRTLEGNVSWIGDMYHWLLTVPHGRKGKTVSKGNANCVISKVRKLASGSGIHYVGWEEGITFYKGEKVDLSYDFDLMYERAEQYEETYGKDKGHGWALRHPIKKLKIYQEYVNGK